jgi:hypothetical protein
VTLKFFYQFWYQSLNNYTIQKYRDKLEECEYRLTVTIMNLISAMSVNK